MAQVPVLTNINREIPEDADDRFRMMLMSDIKASDMYNLLMERSLYGYSDRVVKPIFNLEKIMPQRYNYVEWFNYCKGRQRYIIKTNRRRHNESFSYQLRKFIIEVPSS